MKKTHDAGKISGTLGVTVEQAQFWHERGVQWIVSGASRFMLAEARAYLAGTEDAGIV